MTDQPQPTLEHYAHLVGGVVMQRIAMGDDADTGVSIAALRALQKMLTADPASDDPDTRARSADPGMVKAHLDACLEVIRDAARQRTAPSSTITKLGVLSMIHGAQGGGDQWLPDVETAGDLYEALDAAISGGNNPSMDEGVGETLTGMFAALIADARERNG